MFGEKFRIFHHKNITPSAKGNREVPTSTYTYVQDCTTFQDFGLTRMVQNDEKMQKRRNVGLCDMA